MVTLAKLGQIHSHWDLFNFHLDLRVIILIEFFQMYLTEKLAKLYHFDRAYCCYFMSYESFEKNHELLIPACYFSSYHFTVNHFGKFTGFIY
jgi:hypothetical protein